MAQKQENNRAESADAGKQTGGPGLVGVAFYSVAIGVAKLWHALTSDGVLAAAGRQGIDELGVALKAFPDSIQTHEVGTMFSPTQGEVAADRQHGNDSFWHRSSGIEPPHPWPSEIANENRNLPSKDHGNGLENSHDAGYSM